MSKKKPTKIPKWLKQYRKKVKTALGLDAWEVNFTVDHLDPNDDAQVLGTCNANPGYLSAEVVFHLPHVLEPTVDAKVTVIHELLHVALARTKRVTQNWRDDGIKKPFDKIFSYHYEDAEEETVTRLSRALRPLIERMP